MLKKLLLSTVVGIILTGCGSVAVTDGGGVDTSDDQNNANTPPTTTPTTPTAPNQGSSTNTDPNAPKVQDNHEHYLVFPGNVTRYYFKDIDETGTQAIIKPLPPAPGTNGGKPIGEYAVYNLPKSTYGIFIHNISKTIDLTKRESTSLYYGFEKGSNALTQQLPSSGSIEYSGKAIQYGDKAFREIGGNPTEFPTDLATNPFYTALTFTASVTFGEKENAINGLIYPDNITDHNRFRIIHLKHQEFTGSQFTASDKKAITEGNGHSKDKYEGKYSFSLIGAGAQEINGSVTFDDHPEFNTVFGGTGTPGKPKP